MKKIPLTNNLNQRFTVRLNGKSVTIGLRYVPRPAVWRMDITTNDKSVKAINLVGGVDLIGRFNLGIGRLLLIDVSGSERPNETELGSRFVLMHLSDAEWFSYGI